MVLRLVRCNVFACCWLCVIRVQVVYTRALTCFCINSSASSLAPWLYCTSWVRRLTLVFLVSSSRLCRHILDLWHLHDLQYTLRGATWIPNPSQQPLTHTCARTHTHTPITKRRATQMRVTNPALWTMADIEPTSAQPLGLRSGRNLLKLRSLDSSRPLFLSDNSVWAQWTTRSKCYDRKAKIAFRTSKCCSC